MFETDWNCTTLFKAEGFIKILLGKHIGARSGSTEYFTWQVADRINSQPSPL